MGEFVNFVTKGYSTEERDNKRIVKGHITVEVVDRQNEFIAVDEVMAIIKNYFDIYPAIHDWHSNRPVGKAISYCKSKIDEHPSVYIEAEIYKKDGVTLYDRVWEKITKGEYTGFSMGGASLVREPIVKNGKLIHNLKSLELYEISVCPLPANPLAVFDYVNDFAKSTGMEIRSADDGRQYLQCDNVVCTFGKTDETREMVTPATVDSPNKDYTPKKKMDKSLVERIGEDNGLTNLEKGRFISWVLKEMSREAETKMDDAPKGDKDDKMLEKGPNENGPNVTPQHDENVKKGDDPANVGGEKAYGDSDDLISTKKDAGDPMAQTKAPHVKNRLESTIRKNHIVNIMLN